MKLMVMGHARHGKDTVCELLEEFGNFNFTSSSMFCAEHPMFDEFYNKQGYTSAEECYDDRVNHRGAWFDIIAGYNAKHGLHKLAEEIFKEYDIYCGIRSHKEYLAAKEKELFDLTIWVDASKRLPPESNDSCTVNPYMADIILDNNGTEKELEQAVFDMIRSLDYVLKQKTLYRECALRWMESSNDRS